jgi:hypothetical protein
MEEQPGGLDQSGEIPETGAARDDARDTDSAATVSRRTALKVLAAGAGAAAALPALACAPDQAEVAGDAGPADATQPTPADRVPQTATDWTEGPTGTLTDPYLVNPVQLSSGTLTDDEMRTLASLCDVIIPEDEHSPSASAVGAHEFIDEWVSAPYDFGQNDKVVVRGGLVWLHVESTKRFGREFVDLSLEEKHQICDDIHYLPEAAPEFRAAARFFDKVRDLTATAFYTTEEGMADIQYVGNVASATFEGPPPEVLERLGLA